MYVEVPQEDDGGSLFPLFVKQPTTASSGFDGHSSQASRAQSPAAFPLLGNASSASQPLAAGDDRDKDGVGGANSSNNPPPPPPPHPLVPSLPPIMKSLPEPQGVIRTANHQTYFRLNRKLGSGQYGEVFLAMPPRRHQDLLARVARCVRKEQCRDAHRGGQLPRGP